MTVEDLYLIDDERGIICLSFQMSDMPEEDLSLVYADLPSREYDAVVFFDAIQRITATTNNVYRDYMSDSARFLTIYRSAIEQFLTEQISGEEDIMTQQLAEL